ncbi:hypothetical protein [Deinococcus radiotolerans]|uniref:Uncharacterized protein n=1 Tax=Deinococcus radiotolerans TaxID=1309407 RepID=A0ABQ2FRG7_9DEIO|nr:hypothetical protein [Deinococcus radiotolerans]GGL19847.1 hypothetical protein GCM10010844_43480 [Deinococcus radiotolerans]
MPGRDPDRAPGKTTTTSSGPLRLLLTGPKLMFGPVTRPLAPDEVRFTCTPASPRPEVPVGADVTLRWR